EAKSGSVVQRGQITTEWSAHEQSLRTIYRNRDFCREIKVTTEADDTLPIYANGRISMEVNLASMKCWHASLIYEFGDGEVRTRAPSDSILNIRQAVVTKRLEDWKRATLKIETSNSLVRQLYAQALEDIAALRLPIEGMTGLEFVPAAGVPWFVALF